MESSILKSLGIELPVVFAQSATLIVLWWLLQRFLFTPVAAVMQQRQEQIANSLAGADAQQRKADSLRQEYEGRLAEIADEARRRLDQAVKDAEAERQRLLESAQNDIRDLHERHRAQMALEREQLRRELRAEVADLAVMAATKALRSQLTPPMQSAVTDQIIADLERAPQRSN